MKGTKRMKMSQIVFFPPPMSRRRKTSPMMTISSQNHITHRKKMSMVQRMSRNG